MNAGATTRISARLDEMTRQTGLTHTWSWLAKKTGIEYNRLHDLKHSERRYQVSETVAIAAALGLPRADIFDGVPVLPDGKSGRRGGRQPRPLGSVA